jgi:predicted nucleotidyltransferase
MTFSTSLLYEIEESRREELEMKRQQILEQTIKVIKSVFNDSNVMEVYLTGSIINAYRFSLHSDIDIAVRGLTAVDYFRILSKLEESLLRTVEIIELENCLFSDKIVNTGLRVL